MDLYERFSKLRDGEFSAWEIETSSKYDQIIKIRIKVQRMALLLRGRSLYLRNMEGVDSNMVAVTVSIRTKCIPLKQM